jgi:hypothetical protein
MRNVQKFDSLALKIDPSLRGEIDISDGRAKKGYVAETRKRHMVVIKACGEDAQAMIERYSGGKLLSPHKQLERLQNSFLSILLARTHVDGMIMEKRHDVSLEYVPQANVFFCRLRTNAQQHFMIHKYNNGLQLKVGRGRKFAKACFPVVSVRQYKHENTRLYKLCTSLAEQVRCRHHQLLLNPQEIYAVFKERKVRREKQIESAKRAKEREERKARRTLKNSQ